MGKIKELSALLTNQIAAGEVVERPSSVVKELVENAIDANSTQIDVTIEESGLSRIQVVDNGEGMISEDAILAFQRHATSKLYEQSDLFRIKTLGFRGEALPSIASVSKIVLETSTGQGVGSKVVLAGGEVVEHTAAALRKGTSITVSQLFYNTPARLKFVSSLQRETAHIVDFMNRLALSHPDIAFSLTSDGHTLLKTIGNGDLKQTIAGVYSPQLARKMVWFEAENLNFHVSGYTTLPEETRASKNYISIFINGRYIKNYALNQAIIDGYSSKLMIGRFPIIVLNVTMDFALVDVNVHPTKQQVRISQEKELAQLIQGAINETMQQQNRMPSTLPKRFVEDSAASMTPRAIMEQTHLQFSSATQEMTPVGVDDKQEKTTNLESFVGEDVSAYQVTVASTKQDVKFPELYYFGQMHGTYLFAQNENGLYIVDQHAAQERIKYEYYRHKVAQVNPNQQGMVVPLVLEYALSDYLLIQERLHLLVDIGVLLEPFGQNSFVLNEHPNWIKEAQVKETVEGMIAMLLEKGNVALEKFREDTAIMMSCKLSIKANHYLDAQQASALLEDLSRCDNPYNCPHGRPVLVHLTGTDLEKMFKRIQDR